MTTKDDALSVEDTLKLALEALQTAHLAVEDDMLADEIQQAITAIREALAEQSALDEDQAHYKKVIDDVQALFEAKREEAAIWQAAYETEKGFREQEQSASKPWVGLTDAERAEIQYQAHKKGLTPLEFMELHEAKLKEKNGF